MTQASSDKKVAGKPRFTLLENIHLTLGVLTFSACFAFLLNGVGCKDLFADIFPFNQEAEYSEEVTYTLDPLEVEDGSVSVIDAELDANSNASYRDNPQAKVSLPISCRNQDITNAYAQQYNNLQVKGCGTVSALLSDDNHGSRHQRFIVDLQDVAEPHTVLIAHNIDLAPRVSELKVGDVVTFYGEYEYNPKGGVVHWTHHDPKSIHVDGWIELGGVRFE